MIAFPIKVSAPGAALQVVLRLKKFRNGEGRSVVYA
jgi:hypothetical protein